MLRHKVQIQAQVIKPDAGTGEWECLANTGRVLGSEPCSVRHLGLSRALHEFVVPPASRPAPSLPFLLPASLARARPSVI